MLNLKKKYKGQIRTQRLAARIYDKRAIYAHGLRAKTNFNYTRGQLSRIVAHRYDLNEEDLNAEELDETLDVNEFPQSNSDEKADAEEE